MSCYPKLKFASALIHVWIIGCFLLSTPLHPTIGSKVIKILNVCILSIPVVFRLSEHFNEWAFRTAYSYNAFDMLKDEETAQQVKYVEEILNAELTRQKVTVKDHYPIIPSPFPSTAISPRGLFLGSELKDFSKRRTISKPDGDITISEFKSKEFLTGVISHEVGHLKHKHFEKSDAIYITAPAISYLTQKAVLSLIAPHSRSIVLIPSAVILTGLYLLLIRQINKQMEWQADECIINDTKVLNATAQEHEKFSQQLNENQMTWIRKIFLPHPLCKDRAQRLYERARNISAHETP